MLLLLQIIVTYIRENIITKLQKLCSLPRKPRAGNKSPALFVKKPLCMGDLSPARKIFIERPVNDRVRITKYKNIFSKGYTENWSREIFIINSVLKTNPWTYKIKDLNGEKIIGIFDEK